MRLQNLTAAAVVGRWIFCRRVNGWHQAELRRYFVQETHPGEIVGLVLVYSGEGRPAYPLRPLTSPAPLLLPLDELEIHAVVDPVDVPTPVAPKRTTLAEPINCLRCG